MNYTLFALSTQLLYGLEALKKRLAYLSHVRIQKVSSVYRRIEDKTDKTLSAEIMLVCQASTTLDLEELQKLFQKTDSSGSNTDILLLAFNHEVHLDPQGPIPHPELHLDPLILHCAAEIQGGFEHPVLGRSLLELVKSSQSSFGNAHFEFLARGETLINPNLEVP